MLQKSITQIPVLPQHLPCSAQTGCGVHIHLVYHLTFCVPPHCCLYCRTCLCCTAAQEVNSFKIAVRPERRRQHAQEMRSATAIAIDILTR